MCMLAKILGTEESTPNHGGWFITLLETFCLREKQRGKMKSESNFQRLRFSLQTVCRV